MKASEYADMGQYLRDSRESLRISIEQAAGALHIRPKYLRALESGHLEELPGKAYIRGYIAKYVEYLGLNPAEVFDVYNAHLVHKTQDFFVPEPTLKQNLPSRRILQGAALGMLCIYGFWYFAVHDSSSVDVTVGEMPQEYAQILDKAGRDAMDRAWENCMDRFSIDCFLAARSQSALPQEPLWTYYDHKQLIQLTAQKP